jgi:S-(hydroxymethyl)glutathione dehydrogenase/alcohol dehydrogenase
MNFESIKTNSWVLTKLNKPLKQYRLKIPKLKNGQFLIQIIYTGFCSSQFGEIIGIKGYDRYLPHCLGHEAIGKVIKKKSKKKILPGDHVVLHWMKSSGNDSEKINYYTEKNKIINSGMITTFSDYVVVSENRLTKINFKKEDFVYLSVMGCSLPVGISTIEKIIKPKKNDNILLIGSGAIGLPIIHYCKIKNVKIDAIEIRNKSVHLAKLFGCRQVFRDSTNKKLISNLKNSLYDHVIDTSGNSDLLNFILKIIKPKANICLIGVAKKGKKIKFDPIKINYGIKIIGSYGGDFNPDKDLKKYFNFLKKTNFNFSLYIEKVYKFEKMNKLIFDYKNKKIYSKAVLKL